MEVKNCPKCGKLFTYTPGNRVCAQCIKEEEELFEEIRIFIKEHPNCTMAEVSEQTGVSAKKLIRYIREGRIEISKGMSEDVTCDSCGEPITTGRFCEACAFKLTSSAQEVIKGRRVKEAVAEKRVSDKMHFLSKKKLK